jgi:hypothetical protein
LLLQINKDGDVDVPAEYDLAVGGVAVAGTQQRAKSRMKKYGLDLSLPSSPLL